MDCQKKRLKQSEQRQRLSRYNRTSFWMVTLLARTSRGCCSRTSEACKHWRTASITRQGTLFSNFAFLLNLWQQQWEERLNRVKQEEQQQLDEAALPLRTFLMKHVMPTLTEVSLFAFHSFYTLTRDWWKYVKHARMIRLIFWLSTFSDKTLKLNRRSIEYLNRQDYTFQRTFRVYKHRQKAKLDRLRFDETLAATATTPTTYCFARTDINFWLIIALWHSRGSHSNHE